jgi:sodium/bile acid cotransporter 7
MLRQQEQHQPRQEAEHNGSSSSGSSSSPQNKYLRIARKIFNFVLAQWLIIGFGVGCMLGYFFPRKLI